MIMLMFGLMAVGLVASGSDDADDSPPEVEPVEPPEVPEPPLPPVVTRPGTDDEIVLGNEDDSFKGSDTPELIQGRGGNDSLDGGEGNDTIYGGSNNDVIIEESLDSGNDVIFGGRGDDFIAGGAGSDFIDAGAGDDVVFESWFIGEPIADGNDTIFGGTGNDSLAGYDSIDGGRDDDALYGDNGNDTLIGGDGNDLLFGGAQNDLLNGGSGNDTIEGGYGFDTLNGGAGNDTIYATEGSTLTGGLGADSFIVEEDLSDTLVPRITDFDPAVDSLHIDLTPEDGDDGAFTLVDRADGLGQDLFLGDKLVVELLGNNDIQLDDINITVRLPFTEDGSSEYTIGNSETDIGTQVIGSYGDDIITGSDGGDAIAGRGGSDLIDGGAGNDTLFGDGGYIFSYDVDDGGDRITFLETDTINGGDGDDIIISVNGNDIIGGEGDDVIESAPGALTAPEPLPPTVITDFTPGEDVILLRRVDASLSAEANGVSLTPLEDGTGTELRVEGNVVAVILGGQNLALDDIVLGEIDGQYIPYGPYNVIDRYLS